MSQLCCLDCQDGRHCHHRCGVGNRLMGILHGCLVRRVFYQEQLAWSAEKAT